jgi:uncharacterized protein YdhG (YjbR/CyaY superfamily)
MTGPARLPDEDVVHDGADTGAEDLAAAARAAEVDAWCARLVDDQREAIEHLRAQLRVIVPEATEGIHYRVPTFFLDGPLVALTVNRSELTLITMRPGLLQSMRAGLYGVSWSGSTLRTPLGEPFPDDVLREIVLARAHQNATGT